MTGTCRQPAPLQQAQALERWAEGRERAVAALTRRAERLASRGQVEAAAHLRCTANHLRDAARRERNRAAVLKAGFF
ncbi:hypothetical protein IC232_27260 [Microvirga sp. BT688]|uniref:hypothetical protein n=1 Tax=Microvirga sp. TaxID=1873136 RepID=UPI00168375D4|nr:hypothetical protein [Microvirga sp.]MBD2750363.1 hypothetical protein [Microvirga sp.]